MKFISLDGGATKTIAIIYTDEFEIEGIGISGPANFRTVGFNTFRKNLKNAISQVYSEDVKEMSLALPGIGDSTDIRENVAKKIRKIFPQVKLRLYNDGEAGFHSRFPDGHGIVVAAGTGLVCYGKMDERQVRSSGWGWFLDDEGGAFFIGRRALQEVVKIVDGRSDTNSLLVDEVRNLFNLRNFTDLINKIYRSRIDVRLISSLAVRVSSAAVKGDVLSLKIMEEAAAESAMAIVSTYLKLNRPQSIRISGYGGVFRSGKWYWEMVKKYVQKMVPDAFFREPYFGYEAVLGSIVITYRKHGIEVNEHDLDYLRKKLNEKLMETDIKKRRKYLYF